MASEVQICNLALAQLGDSATVASIDPPEGSAQAEHCALFYPLARDTLLEKHPWSWATRRVALAELADNPSSTWAYAYALPNNLLSPLAVFDPDAFDDVMTSASAGNPAVLYGLPMSGGSHLSPQPFVIESNAAGADVLLTNQESAVLRYVARVTDTSRFTALFVDVLAASLSAMLAGPVVKGDAGSSAAARWTAIAFGRDGKGGKFAVAAGADAGDKRSTALSGHTPAWLAGR